MDFTIKQNSTDGSSYMAVSVKGRSLLINPFTNKGTAFSATERDELSLHGLVPPVVCSIRQQLDRVYDDYRSKSDPLEKYIFLNSLQDRNETLFFRLLLEHLEEMLPIVYTPTVGAACQRFSHIYRRARGLYIDYTQRDRIPELLHNSGIIDPAVLVVTDGERILGLGDQGIGGMGIPIGKLCLYSLCGGIAPYRTLAVMLDVGTDNPERLTDPLYLGLRQKRIRSAAYQDFVDHFVAVVQEVFPEALLQWEDFAKGNAIHQLARFRDQLCTFNDDIQGTAAVVVAGIYAALRLTSQRFADQRFLLAGAGAAAKGIGDLITSAFCEDGLTIHQAQSRIWMFDSQGLVTADRENLESFKIAYARPKDEMEPLLARCAQHPSLAQVIQHVKPTALLGLSGTPNIFDESVVKCMAQETARPLIFPLSNPTSRAECAAGDAIRWSEGRALVATGSPFEPVQLNGQRFRIGQCNNAYIFPGVGLGVVTAKLRRVTDGMFMAAAKALAEQVSAADLAECALFPELKRIRECSHAVACAVIRRGVAEGLTDPAVLHGLEERVLAGMWYPEYLQMRYEPSEFPSEAAGLLAARVKTSQELPFDI